MAANDPYPRSQLPLPRWFLIYAAVVSAIAVVSLVLGGIGVFVNNRQDAQQAADQAARDKDTKTLLDCFDRYARESSASSTAVRAASVEKDAATVARDDALDEEGRAFLKAINHLLADAVTPEDVQDLRDSLEGRAQAAERLDRAQDALDKARRENPVPEPPSTFCSTR